ncbi:ectonucleoside triphosphate diphosphohydrolase 1 isoform X2 [Pristis pectinata]|uniref:ectonucleoside triphosphate diphosphohydrolase 1 isoform X2 n=1 Tax=Pristis pectinata TaxID=685728 RepID=UPI00223CB63A|nr:ectonucleoside triphosphate diphosphohydrolase 1 isoform X2 [Pristis pectinata]
MFQSVDMPLFQAKLEAVSSEDPTTVLGRRQAGRAQRVPCDAPAPDGEQTAAAVRLGVTRAPGGGASSGARGRSGSARACPPPPRPGMAGGPEERAEGGRGPGGIRQNKWRKHPIFFIAILLLVSVIVLVTVAVIQSRPLQRKLKFGVVLDAGSSHTALYIYQWPAEKMNNTGLVEQLKSCSVKGPGISSYWTNVEQAGPSLRACLDEAKQSIPEEQHSETPVYLGATAGMRLLRLQNKSQSEKLLQAVEKFIHSYPFDFQGARIISGADEGAFGWITINYLMENFPQVTAGGPPHTLGALDLGGASTQITFVPNGEIESLENSMHFRLYGRSYHMYTHSYLCFGKDQALKMLLQKLTVLDNGTIFSPCFNKGFEKSINVSTFYNSPCTPDSPTRHEMVKLIGTGNSEECRSHVRRLLNHSSCTWSSCSFNGVYQPQVWGKFGAFSAFYYVMNFYNKNETLENVEQVKAAVGRFCNMSWQEAKKVYKMKEKYLSENCFSGHYVLVLLLEGYNFTSSSWNTIEFLKTIKGSDAGWTLGYMLNLTNMIPAELPYTEPLSEASFLSVMVIFSVLVIILMLIALLVIRRVFCRVEQKVLD